MPSQFSNLNFRSRRDIADWKAKCAEQRRIALSWPAYDKQMLMVEEYGWKIGPWSLRLALEIWRKPYFWHASAAIFEQITYESVTGEHGERYEIPQDALLKRDSWHPEHVEQADFILNEVLGDLTRADDNSQQILIFDGLWARHMKLKYEGEPTWLTNLN